MNDQKTSETETDAVAAVGVQRLVRRWNIGLHGCDDSTCFEMELTDAEVETLRKVAAKAKKTSTYCCMPTMTVEESSPNEPSQLPRPGTRSAGSQDSETTLNPDDTAGRG